MKLQILYFVPFVNFFRRLGLGTEANEGNKEADDWSINIQPLAFAREPL
jgi:hypothetical protein